MSDIDYFAEDAGKNDPFTVDWFNPPSKHVDAPEPHVHRKSMQPVPDADKLFAVQKDLLNALDLLAERKLEGYTRGRLETAVTNAYRTMNRYLRENISGGPGAGTYI